MNTPFVHWHGDLPDLLRSMSRHLPPAGHTAAWRHLGQHVKNHARGLPDLFLWTDRDRRFAEIKGQGDHFSGRQYGPVS